LILCLIYTIVIAAISTAMGQKVEHIFTRPESLLSLYFLVPFSLGILFELRQHTLSDKGTITVFGYITGLMIGLSLVASIRYGFIVGTTILLLFILGFFIGQQFQRHIVRAISKLLQPIVSAIVLNVRLIIGYIALCALISFVFAIVYGQLQIRSGSDCDFKGITGLLEHFVNAFLVMMTFGTMATKAHCDVADKFYALQYILFSIITLIFGALLIKPKKKDDNARQQELLANGV